MRRNIIGLGVALWSLLSSSPSSADAPRRMTFAMCAHPHGPTLNRWSYEYNGDDLVTGLELEHALERHADLALFYYDPNGPVGNLRIVPLKYPNRPTKCEPPPPPKNPPPPLPKEEDEDPPAKERKGNGNGSGKTGNGKGGGGDGDAPPSENTGDGRPPGVKDFVGEKPLTEEEKHFLRKQKLREACLRDPNECDDPLLVGEPFLSQEGVLRQERLLPTPEEMHAQSERRCKQPAKGCRGGKTKNGFETFAEELAFAAAILQGRLNEKTSGPDTREFGVIGGDNEDGPNNPVFQAFVSAIQISVATAQQVAAFEKQLAQAFAKKKMLAITDPTVLSDEAIDKLIEIHGAEEMAAALSQMKVIAPYSVWKRFTAKLGGRWQAHHILEKAKLRFLKGKLDPDLVPSVILTDAEHKAVTRRLAEETGAARTAQELWDGYKAAYAQEPEWLKAIERYFMNIE